MMAANLCEAWRRITTGLIQDALDIYEEDWGSPFAYYEIIGDDHSVRYESAQPLWPRRIDSE
jgi:hypothetical protein